MTAAANQYPVNPQGQEALRFTDPSVTPEASYNGQALVEYDNNETTLRFSEPGDGFIIGFGSKFKYGDGFSPYIIDTDQARYYGAHYETFVRRERDGNGGFKKAIEPFEATVLGDGISGRIGEALALPGAQGPELVNAVEFQYKIGIDGDKVVEGDSPFVVAEMVIEDANHKLEVNRMLGHVAENAS